MPKGTLSSVNGNFQGWEGCGSCRGHIRVKFGNFLDILPFIQGGKEKGLFFGICVKRLFSYFDLGFICSN